MGRKTGHLSIMCGGDRHVFDEVLPILSVFGSQIVYQGEAGAGQHAKMCNQIAIATNMIGVCEAVAYAEKAGLNPDTVLKSISTGAAGSWSLSNLAPRMLNGDFEPGFYVKHFLKDMNIALAEAEAMELPFPVYSLHKICTTSLFNKDTVTKGHKYFMKVIRKPKQFPTNADNR